MNKHIELVKKWLADPDSVSQHELDKNAAAACAVFWGTERLWDSYRYTAWAATAAADAARGDVDVDWVKFWVEKYEERVK